MKWQLYSAKTPENDVSAFALIYRLADFENWSKRASDLTYSGYQSVVNVATLRLLGCAQYTRLHWARLRLYWYNGHYRPTHAPAVRR